MHGRLYRLLGCRRYAPEATLAFWLLEEHRDTDPAKSHGPIIALVREWQVGRQNGLELEFHFWSYHTEQHEKSDWAEEAFMQFDSGRRLALLIESGRFKRIGPAPRAMTID